MPNLITDDDNIEGTDEFIIAPGRMLKSLAVQSIVWMRLTLSQ